MCVMSVAILASLPPDPQLADYVVVVLLYAWAFFGAMVRKRLACFLIVLRLVLTRMVRRGAVPGEDW